MEHAPATGEQSSRQAEVPHREISVSAAIALAQAGCHPQGDDRDRLTAGCRFAGSLRPGDAYWFPGRTYGLGGDSHETVHHVIVVWVPGSTPHPTSSAGTYPVLDLGPGHRQRGIGDVRAARVVRVELDSPYWVPAPGTLDEAAEEALAHHPKCECDTCRPDLAAWHHADCQCTDCQPGMWAAAPAPSAPSFPASAWACSPTTSPTCWTAANTRSARPTATSSPHCPASSARSSPTPPPITTTGKPGPCTTAVTPTVSPTAPPGPPGTSQSRITAGPGDGPTSRGALARASNSART